ncbi:asparaginyl-tRNA synthetase [Coemansia sp. RSA 353]|nr:asparaginyl-tRNA synthetase [Coemansia sp. RSA 1591]KAJ1766050.1 asparaginyl-tRNA synthetase [Coemansia sp. RSA 1752]KAJ1778835.1 asparaginyl-tRNA synthetase [Coemansia sp. RSA 1824]KAJ1790850.1 asparaginyl-tRNA synthetase [Coemansia sp. RSA 2167]KAJ1794170.1 asparaginyl-tRNA synthetase [Coemansia sp. RSA 1938]KAJ2145175.1 asparaginyl-tRNA synthetase [Coemansia sp. RSA 564]KAJ2151793.1 asparaginyl-tRNA synthetase [Coemansia sp. RSA 637]KAJ2161385.1 asparaginyl-tRNA synthetase [Coemansia s
MFGKHRLRVAQLARCLSSSAGLGGLPPTLKTVIKAGVDGADVNITGWVRSVRVQKRIAFAEVADGSTLRGIQIIMDDPQMASKLTTGCAVQITGRLVNSPGREQNKEVQAAQVEVIGPSDSESYPLQKKRHTLEFLREIGHLRPRSQTIGAVTRLRDCAEMGLHKFFHENDFVRIHTPTLTSNDCEGGGETFNLVTPGTKHPETDFFGRKVNLTVSGQLHLEVFTGAFKRAYTFNQAFRAEPSQTGRHLSEFWMVEAECAFVDRLSTLMDVEEEMIRSTTQHLANAAENDLGFFLKDSEPLAKLVRRLSDSQQYPRITYTDAIDILQQADAKAKFVYKPKWGHGLQSEHERYLATVHFEGPVFVTDYPVDIKPFYMLPNADGRTAACMDLLVPGPCELLGGSLRDHNYERLQSKVEQLGFEEGSLDWYVQLRKFGTTPHGGYGMGFERYLQMLTGLDSVRDIIPFPRHAGRCQY